MRMEQADLNLALKPNRYKIGVALNGPEMFIYLAFMDEGKDIVTEMPVVLTRQQAEGVIEGVQRSIAKFDELKMSN